MRILIATDAWYPQVNGVVRTLQSTANSLRRLGHEVVFLTPEGFRTVPLPGYPGLQVALPSRLEIGKRLAASGADAIHIATEGPIGVQVRGWCLRRNVPFTTSYATQFPEYVAARWPVPKRWSYALLRRFHAAAAATMVATPSLADRLTARGFRNLAFWSRGVDTELFRPDRAAALDLPRPIFLSVGRLAVEKNLDAFLALDLPGSKVVIGEGPQEADLRRRFPDAHFLGVKHGSDLASHMAAADVFVFPSRTDTFGLVQLEALACGVPVAAYPVIGPRDVIANHPVGVLDADLHAACLRALSLSREACRAYASRFSWDMCTRQFVEQLRPIAGRRPAGAGATHGHVKVGLERERAYAD